MSRIRTSDCAPGVGQFGAQKPRGVEQQVRVRVPSAFFEVERHLVESATAEHGLVTEVRAVTVPAMAANRPPGAERRAARVARPAVARPPATPATAEERPTTQR